MDPAIKVDGLWEEFRTLEDRARSLKEVVSRFRIARSRTSHLALKDISLEVAVSETVGLIGENGSGKSTLLRCIAGILPPTKGQALVSGTISTLIELGAGFHPELTGRENALIGGVLFGLTRQEIRRKFDSIVSFAELERVIDFPVRSYSSGMYVRLAFSLAVHVEPDIFLIDEVLAVGDEAFQRKCIAKVRQLAEAGVTIIFVSHDLSLIKTLCRRSILLHEGEVRMDGPTDDVIGAYFEIEGIARDRTAGL